MKSQATKIITLMIGLLFSVQIVLQSVPIAERIIVNGDALCTCGCGHTISVCAANHGNNSNCKCQHDKEVETKIKFASNTINDFVLTSDVYFYVKYLAGKLYNNKYSVPDDIIIDILVPPPKFHSA